MNINWFKKMFDGQSSEQTIYEEARSKLWHNGKPLYVGEIAQRGARLYGDKMAIIFGDKKVSFKELYFRASLFGKELVRAGVKQRDRVLISFENSVDFYVAYFAALQSGAVVAPLNTFLHEREVEHIVQDAKPQLIICSQKLAPLFLILPEGKRPALLTEAQIDWETAVPEVVQEEHIPSLDSDEMALLLYTSGTTGLPKGVMLSSRNIMTNMVQNITRIKKVNGEIVSDDAVFAVLPLFHSFAQNMCIWMPMVFGVTVILVAKIERRYILEGLRHKPTIFLGVPALYGLLCLLKNAPIDLVKFFVSGGDALPDKIRAAFKLIYRRRILNGYGMTEATPVISCESEDVVLPTSTVGCPIMHLEYSIRDDYGNPMPSDRIGILWVKGDNVMLGYYNEPEKTAEILQDGWLCTGDLARIDDAGRIVICGREKDLIISKGFNIYPQEIENILLTHPLVIRAAVVGKLADDVGEVPVALVEVREKKEGLDRELRDLCVRQLAPYKVPRAYHLLGMDELPQTATKKINKKKIRADINATE